MLAGPFPALAVSILAVRRRAGYVPGLVGLAITGLTMLRVWSSVIWTAMRY